MYVPGEDIPNERIGGQPNAAVIRVCLIWVWDTYILFDTRRKLVESERKRLLDAQLMIDAKQAMILLAAITAIIRENVKDPDALRAISSGLLRLTGGTRES